jgi:hypothetical protein
MLESQPARPELQLTTEPFELKEGMMATMIDTRRDGLTGTSPGS